MVAMVEVLNFPEIISILEKIGRNVLKRLLIFDSFMTQ